jgi:ribose transport system ATP-binding protein
MNETGPAIEAIEVTRAFGGVRALTAGNLTARFGEVHALVGENGAGKSTLINILGGVVRPESGVVRFNGEDVTDSIASAARAHRVGMVFQELTLFPWMTVAENLFVEDEPRGASRLIQRRKLVTLAEEVLEHYDVRGIDPRALAGSLPLAQRQIVEIIGAFMREPQILFLDEPTSALAEHDVAWLFGLVRKLRDAGAAILFTSHRWNEVASLADRITILRNGAHVATRERFDEDEAVTLMTDAQSTVCTPTSPRPPATRTSSSKRTSSVMTSSTVSPSSSAAAKSSESGASRARGSRSSSCRSSGRVGHRRDGSRSVVEAPVYANPPTRSARVSRSPSYPRTARPRD